MPDRFDKDDEDFRARRRARRLQIEADAKAAETRAFLDEHRERVDAIAQGTPLPIPAVTVGPPPQQQPIPGIARTEHEPTQRTPWIAAEIIGTHTVLPNGNVVIPECRALKISSTGLGLLIRSPNLSKDDWIPISAIHDDSDVYETGHVGDLVLEAWCAKKRGWVS